MSKSRTINECFEAWKGTDKISKSWGEYWDRHLKETIDIYEKLDWKLICLGHDSKLPVSGVHWNVRSLTYPNALTLIRKKMNLGVDLSKSKLIVADIDENVIPSGLEPFINRTMSAITTSSHFHIYFKYDNFASKEALSKLASDLGGKNYLWRGCPNKSQYTVLPPSCVDKKYYEWLNASELMNLSKLMEEYYG